ncbi:MAG: hypothetical protein HF975_04180, partial [ANME-2 cluster archaeon]|nr:hypothetical protein [ANME-2 cluster archaeon]
MVGDDDFITRSSPFYIDDTTVRVKSNLSVLAIVKGWYGVRWPGATSACERTGALSGIAASSSPGNDRLPIQAAMRRCVLDDDGEVVYFLDADISYNREGHSPSITGTD